MDLEDILNDGVDRMGPDDTSDGGVDGMDLENMWDDGDDGMDPEDIWDDGNDGDDGMDPEDISNAGDDGMNPEDISNDGVDDMNPKDISNYKVAHVDSKNIPSNNKSEVPFAVVVPLQRNELAQATERIQSGGGRAIAFKGLGANTMITDNNMTAARPLFPTRSRRSGSVQPNELDTFEPANTIFENVTSASHSPTPTREVKKNLNASREPTRGMRNAQNESVVKSHENGVANLRRRRSASKVRILDRLPVQENSVALEQTQDGSLLVGIANDLRGLIEIGLKVVSRLSSSLCRLCKWILFAYVTWLIITYMCVSTRRFAITALASLCSNSVVGPRISLCTDVLKASPQPLDASKMALSQEELVFVMERAGQSSHLARDMWDGVFAVQDLQVRVELSILIHRVALEGYLEKLGQYTEETLRLVSSFTIETSHAILRTGDLNKYVVNALERIAERQRNPPSLLDLVLLAISPYAAFGPANAGHTGEEIKQIFITTADQIIDDVNSLIKSSSKLDELFDDIRYILEEINRNAVAEIGDLPRVNVLSELLARVIPPKEYKDLKSHQSLLINMAQYYERSSHVVKETKAALIHVGTELSELRQGLAQSRLKLKDQPLESIIPLFWQVGERLEAEHKDFERIKKGGLPRTIDIWTTVTSEATVMKTRTRI